MRGGGRGGRQFVEGSDPHRHGIDETVELGVREGAIDVAVELGEPGIDVVCGQQHFQRPAAADQARQSRHRAATRRQARAGLPAAYICRWDRGVVASMIAFLGAVSGKVIKIGRTQTPTTAIMAPGTSVQPVRSVRTWAT